MGTHGPLVHLFDTDDEPQQTKTIMKQWLALALVVCLVVAVVSGEQEEEDLELEERALNPICRWICLPLKTSCRKYGAGKARMKCYSKAAGCLRRCKAKYGSA